MMQAMNPSPALSKRYDRLSVLLHWLMAGLILAMFANGQVMENGPETWRGAFMNMHATLGLVVWALAFARLGWLIRADHPPLPPEFWPLFRRLAPLAHGLLYIMMLVAPFFGMLAALSSDDPPRLFGFIALPQIQWTIHEAGGQGFAELHEKSVQLLMLLALMHAGMALVHHYFQRRTGRSYLSRMR